MSRVECALPIGGGLWHSDSRMSIASELNRLHASVCKGLADPKRLQIIYALDGGERSVTDLCDELDLPQANVSQHLAIMRERGLVHARKDGQFVFYSLTTPKIIEAVDLLRQVMAMHYEKATV